MNLSIRRRSSSLVRRALGAMARLVITSIASATGIDPANRLATRTNYRAYANFSGSAKWDKHINA
jgi:hypothetical protein